MEDELRDVKTDMNGLETAFTEGLDAISPLNLSDVSFTPYPEVGASDSVQAAPKDVDKFGSNAGLVARTSAAGTGVAVAPE